MNYEAKFIEGITLREIKSEIQGYYDKAYRYGHSVPRTRIWDLEFTKKTLLNAITVKVPVKVLDGRNSNAVPDVITLESLTIVEAWQDEFSEKVYCIELDGEYVPMAQESMANGEYDYVLCASYKTRAGFTKWRKRQFPMATII